VKPYDLKNTNLKTQKDQIYGKEERNISRAFFRIYFLIHTLIGGVFFYLLIDDYKLVRT